MNNVSASVPVVLEPVGVENCIGLLSYAYAKDPLDPAFEDDPAMKDWRAWMSKYLPGEDVRRPSFVNGYNSAATMVQVLKQAGDDLSRENIMRQATNLRDVELPMLLPGIKVNTSPTDYYPVQQLQLARFDGKRWCGSGIWFTTSEGLGAGKHRMELSAAAAGLMASLIASQLSAQEAYRRVFLCSNDDAKMEIYVPESAWRDSGLKDGLPALGLYALDLSDPDLNKGKSLEAVLVRYAKDRRALILYQFSRGLPLTAIPMGGGVVNFDNRFGSEAKCGPFEGPWDADQSPSER
jgi:hypothetical protein